MQYVYAAMLLHSAKKEVTESSVEAIIKAAGSEVDKAKVKSLVEALKNVDIDAAIKEASVAPVAMAAAPAASGSAKAQDAPEEKKVTMEDAAAGLGSLFG